MDSENRSPNIPKLMTLGGYLLLIGVLVGIALGAYALSSPRFFLVFLNMSEFEAPPFFLAMYLPGLIVMIGIGYVLASKAKLNLAGARRTTLLCVLTVLCLTFASLTVFNALAVAGGVIALLSLTMAQTKPSFKVLWKREASFLVELGSMLVMSASLLFLFMLVISKFLRTYSTGVYSASASYPYVLAAVACVSFLTFAVTPFLGLRGSKTGLVAMLALVSSVSSFIAAIQNAYIYTNPAVYLGLSMLGAGIILAFVGGVIHFKLTLSGELLNAPLEPSFTYRGRHCPYCGIEWKDARRHICSNCNQNVYSEQRKSFCPHCGRIIHAFSGECSHCGEDVSSLPLHITLNSYAETKGIFARILDSLDLTTKQFISIVILVLLFNFASYLAYVRIATPIVVMRGSETTRNYGLPLEWLQIIEVWASRPARIPGLTEWYSNFGRVAINYSSFLLDLTIYFLLAFTVVYGSAKLKRKLIAVR